MIIILSNTHNLHHNIPQFYHFMAKHHGSYVFVASLPGVAVLNLWCWHIPSILCSVGSRRVASFPYKACWCSFDSFQDCNVDWFPPIQWTSLFTFQRFLCFIGNESRPVLSIQLVPYTKVPWSLLYVSVHHCCTPLLAVLARILEAQSLILIYAIPPDPMVTVPIYPMEWVLKPASRFNA